MTRPVIVLGGGGHGRAVIDALRSSGRAVLGVADPALAAGSLVDQEVSCLGADEAVSRHDPASVLLCNGVGSVAPGGHRQALFQHWGRLGYEFTSVVHPSASVSSTVQIAEGAQVMAGAVVQTGAKLGRNALVNTSASIDHDCVIGDHVHIAPGAVLSGDVVIGADCHVGTGAAVVQGVRIGAGSLVGAGSVVVGDLLPGTRVTAGGRGGERRREGG